MSKRTENHDEAMRIQIGTYFSFIAFPSLTHTNIPPAARPLNGLLIKITTSQQDLLGGAVKRRLLVVKLKTNPKDMPKSVGCVTIAD